VLFEKVRFGAYTARTGEKEAEVSIDRKHPIAVIKWDEGE